MDNADEFYAFPGDANDGKPPYWVARHGTTVTEQVDVRDPRVVRYGTVEVARARFAEVTCEPNGPGAPLPGDRIVIVYGPGRGNEFTVTASSKSWCPGGWIEFEVHGWSQPLALVLGQYRIVSRPAA